MERLYKALKNIQKLKDGCEKILAGDVSEKELSSKRYEVDGLFIEWTDETLK